MPGWFQNFAFSGLLQVFDYSALGDVAVTKLPFFCRVVPDGCEGAFPGTRSATGSRALR